VIAFITTPRGGSCFESDIAIQPPKAASAIRLTAWWLLLAPCVLDGWFEPVALGCMLAVAAAAIACDSHWLWRHWGPHRVLRLRCSDRGLWLLCADQTSWQRATVSAKSMGRFWLRLELRRSDERWVSIALEYPTVDSDAYRRLRVLMRFLPAALSSPEEAFSSSRG